MQNLHILVHVKFSSKVWADALPLLLVSLGCFLENSYIFAYLDQRLCVGA